MSECLLVKHFFLVSNTRYRSLIVSWFFCLLMLLVMISLSNRFWLFEPRCGMHDIGGWYVETFGRDKKGRNVPSQRYWDGLEANDHFEK